MIDNLAYRITDDEGRRQKINVRRLSRKEWSSLILNHGPRAGTNDRVWNTHDFPPALIAASTGIDVATARRWWNDAPEDESNGLFETCLRLSSPGSADWAVRALSTNSRLLAEVQAAARLGIPHSTFVAWSVEDQDLAIALGLAENDRCPGGCGVTRAEMQDPTAYKVVTSRCVWCQQLNAAREEMAAEDRSHRHVTLIPNDDRGQT